MNQRPRERIPHRTDVRRHPHGLAPANGEGTRPMMSERKTWRRVRLSLVRESAEHPYAMRCGGDVAALVRAFLRDDPRERFVAVYLDNRHRPIAIHDACTGTADSSVVHPREVFGPALQLAATAIVVAHNHPSGDPTPSPEDRSVTERLREAGDLLGVRMLDHLVIGEREYYSFTDGIRHPYREVVR